VSRLFPRRSTDWPDGLMALLVVNVTLSALILGLLIPGGDLRRTDPGGSLALYARQAKTWDGPLPVDCRSACTMYLLRGCVTPAHRLTFHTPKPDTPFWRGYMAQHYPPAIAAWFEALPVGSHVYKMAGADAIRWGASAC
jgi:hypothetical protein